VRNLLVVCAGLVVALGVMCGSLWRQLRADQQLIADVRAEMEQMARAKTPGPEAAPARAAQPAAAAAALAAVQAAQPKPVATVALPESVVVLAAQTLGKPSEETRRAAAMADSDQTATARVLAWRDRLAIAGVTLTTAQLQALNTAALTEMRRETEDSLAMDSPSGPMDAETVVRQREETINRQNDTNMRILQDITPQLSAEQAKALRDQFEAGDAARRAAARADREALTNSGK